MHRLLPTKNPQQLSQANHRSTICSQSLSQSIHGDQHQQATNKCGNLNRGARARNSLSENGDEEKRPEGNNEKRRSCGKKNLERGLAPEPSDPTATSRKEETVEEWCFQRRNCRDMWRMVCMLWAWGKIVASCCCGQQDGMPCATQKPSVHRGGGVSAGIGVAYSGAGKGWVLSNWPAT